MFNKLKKLKTINIVHLLKLNKVERQLIFLIAIGVFLLTNILLAAFSLRLDLSQGKVYTLSLATKKIVKNVDDITQIKFFVSSDLPSRLQPLKTDVIDLMREYEKQGNKIQLKILDPKKDPAAAQQAKEMGIPELQFSQVDQDKYAVSTAYFGLALSYGNKTEIIPQITEVENLEYNVTSAMYKLTKKELPKIGILGLDNIFDPQQDPISSLRQLLGRQFAVEPITIATGSVEKIDPSIKTVVVFDPPQKQYTDLEKKALKDYLDKKGSVVFFTDGIALSEDNLQGQPAPKNTFSSLFADYGIKIQNNLLLSTAAELVNFGNDVVSFLTPYPFWLKTNSFNKETGYFSNINQLTFPWASSISVQKKNNVDVKELVKTTQQSWEQKGTFILDPQNIPQPSQKDLKQFIVAAQSDKKNGGKIVVFSSSRFTQDRYLSRNSSNLELVLNLLNDLATGGALSGIRQRVVNFYPIPALPEGQKDLFKYGNILLLPALFGLYGAFRIVKRK